MNSCTKRYLITIVLFSIILLKSPLFPDAKAGINQLETRLTSATGEERIEILAELTKTYSDEEPQKTLTYGKEALELLERFPNPALQIDILNDLCSVCIYLGEYDASSRYANQCLEISKKTGHKRGQADALYYMGRNNYYQGVYDRAADFYSRARLLYEAAEDQKGLAETLNAYGLVYWRLSDYSTAMEYILDSCKIRESLKGTSREADIAIAFSYNNIGLIYLDLENYKKAMEYMIKGKKIHESLDNKSGIAIAVNNIAAVYRNQGKYTDALEYYRKALQHNKALGFRHGTAITLNNIGKVYEKMENYNKALDYLKKSLKISKEINQQNIISNTSFHIGRIRRKLGQYQEAIQWVNQGLGIASEINVKDYISDANQELAEIYKALKDYPQSLHYLKKYKEINDLIFNETSSKKIAEMQTRYEMGKNEKEITLLKKDKAIRELALIRQRYFTYFIIIGSLLIFIVGFVIYTRYRLKVKMTRALSEEIREHKQTTQKLQENEEKFRTLAETSVVGIYILQDHVIKYVNPKFLTIFAATREEIIGQNFLKLVYEEDHPQVIEKINQRTDGAADNPGYEFRGLTRDRDIIHLESYGGLTHYRGQPAVLETIIDITNRKKNAEKLLNSHKLEAMGILTGGIAHDFNNLLTIIVGYLEMVKDEIQTGAPAYRLLQNIENNCKRAAALGEELTSFAKGGWIIPQNVTLSSILNSALEKRPEIETLVNYVSIPADLRPIYGDERQLKQMVIYLLIGANEIQTGKEKEEVIQIQVSITAENIDLDEENEFSLKKGEYVRVFFKDNSRGIPTEQLEKIFDPSFSPSFSRSRTGMGLELAICQSVTRKHNGHIAVTSEVGTGTTFELILPAPGTNQGGAFRENCPMKHPDP
jgi:PAS domain S-box-containing protein